MSRSSAAVAIPDSRSINPTPKAAAPSPAQEAESGADRRIHQRYTLADIPLVTRVRLRYGPVVTLIDLSVGGMQIETTSFRLQPGSSVVVELVGDDREIAVPATVLRCQLASLLPEPVYRGALAFKNELDVSTLGVQPQVKAAPEPAAAPEPELALEPGTEPQPEIELALAPEPDLPGEQNRLRQMLMRLGAAAGQPPTAASRPGAPASVAGDPAPLVAALASAVAVLDTPAGRRSGPALGSELAGLLKATADALEGHARPEALIGAIEDHLRRVIPARAVRLDDSNAFQQLPGSEAILFAIPSLDPATPPAKVVVEFSAESEPLEWQMQLLKAALQLIALVRELARRSAGGPIVLATGHPLPAGWSRIVARYTAGQTIKGFTQYFLAANGSLMLSPSPDAPGSERVTVPFKDLRAIFFVRDHEGHVDDKPRKTFDPASKGRKVSVTFGDGEEIVGTTVNYLKSAPGFFVQPADPKSNTERVFVVSHAVKDVRFF